MQHGMSTFAVGHGLGRGGRKKTTLTRRDLTLGRIADNLIEYNDPVGQPDHFRSMLLGQ